MTRFKFGRIRHQPILVGFLVGVSHLVVVGATVHHLDYPVDTFAHTPGGMIGAVIGLILLFGIPTAIVLHSQIVLPIIAAISLGGWSIYREFTTPVPEFSTLGGHIIINGTRYVDAYVDAWYVWMFTFLLLGVIEYVMRSEWDWFPAPIHATRLERFLEPDTRSSLRFAFLVAIGHLSVFFLLAADSGYFVPGGFLPSPWYIGVGVLVWSILGLGLIGGVPAFLFVRARLITPMAGLSWLVYRIGWTQNTPSPDDSLPLYFIGWFFFVGLFIVLGSVEYGVRRVGHWIGITPVFD